MTCREVAEFLADYLDQSLAAEVAGRFEEHLAGCTPCRNYLHAYRTTILASRNAWPVSDDSGFTDVPEDLIRAILDSRRRQP